MSLQAQSDRAQPVPSSLAEASPARAHFAVRAVREASVLSRVVELFVLRGLVPTRVTSEAGAEHIRIELTVDGLEAAQADHIAQRIRQFPTVESVLLRREV